MGLPVRSIAIAPGAQLREPPNCTPDATLEPKPGTGKRTPATDVLGSSEWSVIQQPAYKSHVPRYSTETPYGMQWEQVLLAHYDPVGFRRVQAGETTRLYQLYAEQMGWSLVGP